MCAGKKSSNNNSKPVAKQSLYVSKSAMQVQGGYKMVKHCFSFATNDNRESFCLCFLFSLLFSLYPDAHSMRLAVKYFKIAKKTQTIALQKHNAQCC